jgi:uncharacterized membrane protein
MKTLAWLKDHKYGVGFTILGVIGWIAAFTLLTDYIHTLKDPSFNPSCNISVLVACGPNMVSKQGSLLGFSNTILGVMGFTVPILVGFLLMGRTKLSKWFWLGLAAGHTGSLALVLYLVIQSVFFIGTLCPWCMVVWTVTIPMFFMVWTRAAHAWKEDGKLAQFLSNWMWLLIFVCYITIALVSQLRLNWLAEFTR